VAVCAEGDVLSVARKVAEKLPVAVGVPEIVPAALRVRPAGRLPEAIDQE
jgi:hypothetical protein